MTANELNIIMIAHKGYSGKYYENTESAFLGAAAHGSQGAETDIRMTNDGVLVCHHNRDAVFKDGSTLVIADSTYDELTAKPLRNTTNDDDVYICTFRRYLEIMRDNNMLCFVELKDSFTDEQLVSVFEMVKEVYDISKCLLQSFDFDNLVRIHGFFPELQIMLTYGKSEKNYERCFDYGFSLDVDQFAVTEQMINDFHERNLQVAVWTCNEKEDFERCKKLGVEYIESDFFGGND